MANVKKVLCAADREHLRQEITEQLQIINNKLDEDGVREIKDLFCEKFVLCEIMYKIVLKEYLKLNHKYTTDSNMKIQLSQVKAAMECAGYEIELELLERLFSGSGEYMKRGQKSAKKLRNGIMHDMNIEDLKELISRQQELFADMDKFLELLQK